MKAAIIVGTRPEIVKMASIVNECERRGIDHFLLHTGQHFSSNMSKQFFADLDVRLPDKNLNIGSGSHSEQTAKALVGIEKELIEYDPDIVLVQGDTNAVLSAALVSVKLQIPVGHVEAGLRSYDYRMPEEHNRRLTDHASSYLFAPTEVSADILREEHVWGEIHVTGNTVIDILESIVPKAIRSSEGHMPEEEFVLLTLHRAENVDDRKTLSGLIQGISSLQEKVVFPAHPRTVSRLKQFGMWDDVQQRADIEIIEPVGYLQFIGLMLNSKYILTDSGGIQEEVTAPSINKRAFVLRTTTERPEAVHSGHVTVVGVDPKEFPKTIKRVLQSGEIPKSECPYGRGDAASKIVDILEQAL